jgi:hypothetical protein
MNAKLLTRFALVLSTVVVFLAWLLSLFVRVEYTTGGRNWMGGAFLDRGFAQIDWTTGLPGPANDLKGWRLFRSFAPWSAQLSVPSVSHRVNDIAGDAGRGGLRLESTAIALPVWTLGAPLMVLSCVIVWRWRATCLGCCVKCGYDLRGSTDRCPECGLDIVAVDGGRPG